jgi:hypothetical protein
MQKYTFGTFVPAMKQLFSILLMCSILGQAFVRTAWTLHYQWDRAVYLKNCENRDKADLHCDGKCYLKKKMAASENPGPQEPQLPAGFHQIKDIQLFFEFSYPLPFLGESFVFTKPLPLYVEHCLPDAPHTGIFKPPAVA